MALKVDFGGEESMAKKSPCSSGAGFGGILEVDVHRARRSRIQADDYLLCGNFPLDSQTSYAPSDWRIMDGTGVGKAV